MNPAEIIAAIKAHLGSPEITGLMMVWPNTEAQPARPYAMVEVDLMGAADRTIDRTRPEIPGVIRVLIVTDEGIGDRDANTFAWYFALRFAPPTVINFAGGLIECNQSPGIKKGYAQGAAWRVPLEVPFLAHT